MKSYNERLIARHARAHVRFVEDVNLALEDAILNHLEVAETLREQVEHGRKLVKMAEGACKHLALSPDHQLAVDTEIIWSLAQAARAFRALQGLLRSSVPAENGPPLEKELASLIEELDDRRAELIALRRAAFPGLEPDLVAQAIKDLDAGQGRPLETVLSNIGK
jgi:hypothetical protein